MAYASFVSLVSKRLSAALPREGLQQAGRQAVSAHQSGTLIESHSAQRKDQEKNNLNSGFLRHCLFVEFPTETLRSDRTPSHTPTPTPLHHHHPGQTQEVAMM